MQMKKRAVITIGREYGSGGREIGERLADRLGIRFLDKNLLNEVEKESGISVAELEEFDERPMNSRLEPFIPYDFNADTLSERLFDMQAEVILKHASENSCVIVGRCADVVLEYQESVFNFFIYADEQDKIARIMRIQHLTDEKQAAKVIRKTEKIRRNYYQYFTDAVWGDRKNKALMINSSDTGIDGAVDLIVGFLRMKGYVE